MPGEGRKVRQLRTPVGSGPATPVTETAMSAFDPLSASIATALREAPGAAEYFEGGFVVYTPGQKSAALSVSPDLIKEEGAVSQKVAVAMTDGV
jgi:hypothetical protein